MSLRSRDNNIRAFVKFSNCTERECVEVHWINFHGNSIHYSSLMQNQTVIVNTCKCALAFCLANPLSHARRSLSQTQHILGFSSVKLRESGCVSTIMKFSSQNRGSILYPTARMAWCRWREKRLKFIYRLNRWEKFAFGNCCSWLTRKMTSTRYKYPRLLKTTWSIFFFSRRDIEKMNLKAPTTSETVDCVHILISFKILLQLGN
jgi:hypothetical protein